MSRECRATDDACQSPPPADPYLAALNHTHYVGDARPHTQPSSVALVMLTLRAVGKFHHRHRRAENCSFPRSPVLLVYVTEFTLHRHVKSLFLTHNANFTSAQNKYQLANAVQCFKMNFYQNKHSAILPTWDKNHPHCLAAR